MFFEKKTFTYRIVQFKLVFSPEPNGREEKKVSFRFSKEHWYLFIELFQSIQLNSQF